MMILLVGDRRRSIDGHCRWSLELHGLGDLVQHGGESKCSDKLRRCCLAELVGDLEPTARETGANSMRAELKVGVT